MIALGVMKPNRSFMRLKRFDRLYAGQDTWRMGFDVSVFGILFLLKPQQARRHNMANAKPAMRAAQAKVVAPRYQQQPPQRQRPYQGQQRLANQQSRGRGRTFQGSSNRVRLNVKLCVLILLLCW